MTKTDTLTILAIARRAAVDFSNIEPLQIAARVAAVHKKCPLRLGALLTADGFDLWHDVHGMLREADDDGNLLNFFLPRYAEKQG